MQSSHVSRSAVLSGNVHLAEPDTNEYAQFQVPDNILKELIRTTIPFSQNLCEAKKYISELFMF